MPFFPPIGTADLELTGSYTVPVGTADLSLQEPPPQAVLAGETLSPTGQLHATDPTIYSPPVGIVGLALSGAYTLPTGTADLHIGPDLPVPIPECTGTLAGETLAPTGVITSIRHPQAILVGETLAPTGLIQAQVHRRLTLAGETLAPIGQLAAHPVITTALAGETQAPIGALALTFAAPDPNVYIPPVGTVPLRLTETYVPPVGTVDLNLGVSPEPEPQATVAGETLVPSGALRVVDPNVYPPPVGTVDLNLEGAYTPPVGRVHLHLGFWIIPGRQAILNGETQAPTGRITSALQTALTLAGETLSPIGAVTIQRIRPVRIQGETLAPVGALVADYDPNLLSDVHHDATTLWQAGDVDPLGTRVLFQDSPLLSMETREGWQEAEALPDATVAVWQPSERVESSTIETWQEAGRQGADNAITWQSAPRLEQVRSTSWQEAESRQNSVIDRFNARLPRLDRSTLTVWQPGDALSHLSGEGWQEGLRQIAFDVEVWQRAGTPSNAPNPRKDIKPLFIPPWGTALQLRCPLPGTTLRIGRTPCILIAEREVPLRRSYVSTNTATLVRWPDLTPLPCTAMTISTDFDSWCWSLSATLAGPEAFALVQPNPLACEVQATINGQVWRFLLDVPATNRSFNSDQVTLKGRSRSAWLHDPFTPHRNFSETQAREMVQLAEAALENTGWTLDWQTENWVVPAGRYNSWNTPISVLIRLINTTNDGLYTDPTLQVISTLKRWPVASWLLDGQTMDILVPEAAIISLTQSPVYTQPLNGVYVSGTSHGALALVKIAGTDGALQPDEPITDELLCDEDGVAARQRGLNVLSDSGAGWEMDAETLFNPLADPAFPLVPPGLIVSIAGLKGISRSCSIQASRSSGVLSVRQSIGLERREVET